MVRMTRHVQGVEVGYATYAPWRFVRAHGGDHIVVNRSATPQRYSALVRMTHHVQGAEVGCVKLHSAAVRTRSRRQSHSRQARCHSAEASWRFYGQHSTPHSGLGTSTWAPAQGYRQPPAPGCRQPPAQGCRQPPAQGCRQPPAKGCRQPPAQGCRQPPAEGCK